MSLKEFSDRFKSTRTECRGNEDYHLQLSIRKCQNKDNTIYYPIRLEPHLNNKQTASNAGTILGLSFRNFSFESKTMRNKSRPERR